MPTFCKLCPWHSSFFSGCLIFENSQHEKSYVQWLLLLGPRRVPNSQRHGSSAQRFCKGIHPKVSRKNWAFRIFFSNPSHKHGQLVFPMIITANVFLCINISNRFSPTPAEVVVLPLSRTWVNLAWKIESKRWLESCGSTDVDGYVFLKSFFLKHRYFQ